MSPCEGCLKRIEMNMGITGKFKMRFIGRPNGKTMKGAPRNFVHGEIYTVPFGHSKRKYWKLLEKIPELKVPEETESFKEAYFIPEEETATVELIQTTSDIALNPTSEAIIEPYASVNPLTGEMGKHIEHPKRQEEPESEEIEVIEEPMPLVKELDRDTLLEVLAEAGVEVKKRTRTTTLKKMVDALEED